MIEKLPLKIVDLRNEIYKDIYDQNKWVYVKMQALVEFVSKMYITEISSDENMRPYGGAQLVSILANHFKMSKATTDTLFKVNSNANILKHETDSYQLKKSNYNSNLVKLFVEHYNLYCKHLFLDKGKLFYLENNMHTDKLNNNIVVEKSVQSTRVMPRKQTIRLYSGTVVINSGVVAQDYGFTISRVAKKQECNNQYAPLYAVIYNFLQRGRLINKSTFIKKVEEETRFNQNYKNIYRYKMIVLSMIRYNFFEGQKLNVQTLDGNNHELLIAIDEINYYIKILANLMQIKIEPLTIDDSKDKFNISIFANRDADVFSSDHVDKTFRSKETWFERSINYNCNDDKQTKSDLKVLLHDFFGYTDFKLGQEEALLKLLNQSDDSIVIMPTGGGKSLLFYFLAMLQPNPTIIIAPTEVLIKDQARNLKELHNIDDILCVIEDNQFDEDISVSRTMMDLNKKLNFITPERLQYREIILKLINHNSEGFISNIILDEIHTISNWSHDFRPDYLMLSFNLQTFMDNARYIGFTATANFRVLKDIVQQLNIDSNNLISPIDLTRSNINFDFIKCNGNKSMSSEVQNIVNKAEIERYNDYKALIFTKDEAVSKDLFNDLHEMSKHNIDVLTSSDPYSYDGFVKGRKSVLISQPDMGVGINIPMVQNVIHYGFPISKGQFVQEIGRLDRFGEGGLSTVLYKPRSLMDNYEKDIIDFNTPIDEILSILSILDDKNDLKLSLVKMLGHIEHYSKTASDINGLYERLSGANNSIRVSFNKESTDDILKQQVAMYFLFRMGFIYNWYIVSQSGKKIVYDIELEEFKSLLTVKRKSVEYISSLGENRDVIFKIEQSESIKNIIYIIQDWYYNQFLKYHREQFLNVIEFLEINSGEKVSQNQMSEQLSDYFSTALVSGGASERHKVISMTVEEMIENVQTTPDPVLVSRVQSIIENEYDAKLDLFISINNIFNKNHFNESRFTRAIQSLDNNGFLDLWNNVFKLYNNLSSLDAKLHLINSLSVRKDFNEVLENLFSRTPKDVIYFAYLAKHINLELGKLRGRI